MENTIWIFGIIFGVAVLVNIVMGVIDLKIKTEVMFLLGDFIHGGSQTLALKEEQMKEIAKIVGELINNGEIKIDAKEKE